MNVGSGKNNGNTFAKATRAFVTRISVLEEDLNSPPTRMAEAALSWARANQVSLSAKVRSPLRAASAGAKPDSSMVLSPSTVPPICLAISAAVNRGLDPSFINNLVLLAEDNDARLPALGHGFFDNRVAHDRQSIPGPAKVR